MDDNPELCTTESCGKKNLFVPLVASCLTLIIILLIISLGLWILRRQKGTLIIIFRRYFSTIYKDKWQYIFSQKKCYYIKFCLICSDKYYQNFTFL